MTHARAPFVGRTAELELLRGYIDARAGAMLLIGGEAGVGKTRLVAEAIPVDRRIATIAFPSALLSSPGFGLRRLAEIGGNDALVLAAELDSSEEVSGQKAAAVCEAANAFLRKRAPAVLVLDDVQWADELTLMWLSRCGSMLEADALVVVVIVRAPHKLPSRIELALSPIVRARRLESLSLRPLREAEVLDLATAVGSAPNAAALAELYAKTDGLPLAVEELLAHPPSGVELTDERIAPSAISMIVREQFGELDANARLVVACTALVPQPPSEHIVRAAVGLADEAYDVALERALDCGLLFVHQAGFAAGFRHELHREALQQELALAEQRALHRRIASILSDDPHAEPTDVATQHIAAGDVSQAITWLERAAEASVRMHDYGTALAHLKAAIELCPHDERSMITRLAVKVPQSARAANRQSAGLALMDLVLARVVEPLDQARLLMARSALSVDLGDFRGHVDSLRRAEHAFTRAGDDLRRAIVLGMLALPVDDLIPLSERVALGREGLQIARGLGDAFAIARCAGSLATAELCSGNQEALGLWEEAARAAQAVTTPGVEDETLIVHANWATSMLLYGAYEEAGRVIRSGLRIAEQQSNALPWMPTFGALEVMRLWRCGRWDDALAASEPLRDESKPDAEALLSILRSAIAFERERKPEIRLLEHAIDAISALGDQSSAALGRALSVRIRLARREPNPVRAVVPLVQQIVAVGLRLGWDDLLPAVAAADISAYRGMLGLLEDLRPVGPRAEAAIAFAAGIFASSTHSEGAIPKLIEATERYMAIGEPYASAQALDVAAKHELRVGGGARDFAERAAEIYSDLGAHRSLARLLHRGPRSRMLDRYRTPMPRDAWGLTPREHEVARLAGQGLTARTIADELVISVRTVQLHLERVKRKLGVERKSDLVRALSTERV